jgi:hypothetical protein
MVGRVTPCAPLCVWTSGAHGLTRPTNMPNLFRNWYNFKNGVAVDVNRLKLFNQSGLVPHSGTVTFGFSFVYFTCFAVKIVP